MDMETVVILGAAGRIGDTAARAFLAKGWKVKGVARNAKADQLAAGVEPVRADAFDREALVAACKGADVVLNCLNPEYTEWAEKVLPMAQNVAAAVQAAGATHMLPGNVYNFGHGIGLDTGEDAPQIASTQKAAIRMRMEDLFRDLAQSRGIRTVVLRAGDFYGGPKTGNWMDLIILAKLRKGIFTWPGPMDLPHAFAYLPDLGATFVALAGRRAGLGGFERFHFAGHTMTGDEMKLVAEEATGRRLKRAGVPWALLRAAGLVNPMMREVTIMSYLWRTPHSLDGSRLQRFLGTVPATDPVEAMREAIAALGLGGEARQAA
jgi:nucleoside-diphosphate-sugar epimerase